MNTYNPDTKNSSFTPEVYASANTFENGNNKGANFYGKFGGTYGTPEKNFGGGLAGYAYKGQYKTQNGTENYSSNALTNFYLKHKSEFGDFSANIGVGSNSGNFNLGYTKEF